MKVGGVNDFAPAFVDPELLMYCLAVGAVSVAAGVGMEDHTAALSTGADVVAELSCFTVHDTEGSARLSVRWVEMRGVFLPAVLKNLLDLSHGKHLPSGREDLPPLKWPGRQDGRKWR